MFEQIWDLVYKGKGGFTFSDVYLMPINLRSFYYMKLAECIVAEQNAANGNVPQNNNNNFQPPNR